MRHSTGRAWGRWGDTVTAGAGALATALVFAWSPDAGIPTAEYLCGGLTEQELGAAVALGVSTALATWRAKPKALRRRESDERGDGG